MKMEPSSTLVIAFYRLEDGSHERYEMQRIDFVEAQGRFPDLWSLEQPDGKIHNKVPLSVDVMTQMEAQSRAAPATPPVVQRQPKPVQAQPKPAPANHEPATQHHEPAVQHQSPAAPNRK